MRNHTKHPNSYVEKLKIFKDDLNKHFNIGYHIDLHDSILSLLFMEPKINIIAFDDYLVRKHGDYNQNENLSMSDFIKKEYGKEAHNWFERHL